MVVGRIPPIYPPPPVIRALNIIGFIIAYNDSVIFMDKANISMGPYVRSAQGPKCINPALWAVQ